MAEKRRHRRFVLSDADKKILKALLGADSRLSTTALAGQVGIPRATAQRRRRFLEDNIIVSSYSMDLAKFGYRRVDFLIETKGGFMRKIVAKLLELPEVISVSRTIGEHTIDIIAELLVKDNGQILQLTELVKGMKGVGDVTWTEVVEVTRKKVVPDQIIDDL
ncbi:MAG: Lrp/AsnC family transcriptional regulator [Thaumarchaeota archaeon]|nr:Lrp/AsnC family transcriptional regulator [Nitrososphaerota archaeon]